MRHLSILSHFIFIVLKSLSKSNVIIYELVTKFIYGKYLLMNRREV